MCALGEVPKDGLERAVVDAAIEFYLRYSGKGGRKRLFEAALGGVALRRDERARRRAEAEKVLERVDGAIRTLLDNLTARNREHVDRRIGELEQERTEAQDCLECLERRALDEQEAYRAAAAAAEFLATLPSALRDGALERRISAVRRCVKRIVIDSEKRSAAVEFWTTPAELGKLEARRSEAVFIVMG